METVKAKVYSLRTESGQWLGEVVLTQNGLFMSVTDWGNLSYGFGAPGDEDFRAFFLRINTDYLAGKLVSGLAYTASPTKSIKESCKRFAEKILPAFQAVLKVI